jgi:lipid II:glycine glycyltransferase (peptidoglycan interpeptide bridge formation enzyme)
MKETKFSRLSKKYPDYSYFYMRYLDENILHKLFQAGIARPFVVKKEDHVLCVSLDIVHNKKAYDLLIGTSREGYRLRAPAFLHAKLIERLKSEGIEYLNLGAVGDDPSDEGLVFFKTSFGAREHITTGGRTSHLQSSVLSRLFNLYEKLPKTRIQALINKKLRGRTYR